MTHKYQPKSIGELKQEWATDPRWKGIQRSYNAEDVDRLRGTFQHDHTIARMGSERFWNLMHEEKYIRALGALTGNQAVEMVQAGLKAIYLSGWQVAGDANDALTMYPDQSLYPVTSVPTVLRKINNALIRADQIQHMEGRDGIVDYFAPIIADAEAGFGGPLNTFELIKSMIEAGAAAVHLEDQLSSLKKCGHMGGKVLVPIHDFVQKLVSARLAADVQGVPTVIIGRTDALGATLIRGDIDRLDREFLTGERTSDGFYILKNGIDYAIARALEFAPYVDLLWCETATPDLEEARLFAESIHEKYPNKLLAYNCSPSFNWKRKLDDEQIASFQEQLADMGYKFQFITLAGFHTLNASMYDLAWNYARNGMTAFVKVQEREFEMEREMGFRAVKHQSFVGAGYFDQVQVTVTGSDVSTSAMRGSTEEEQFATKKPAEDSFVESSAD